MTIPYCMSVCSLVCSLSLFGCCLSVFVSFVSSSTSYLTFPYSSMPFYLPLRKEAGVGRVVSKHILYTVMTACRLRYSWSHSMAFLQVK